MYQVKRMNRETKKNTYGRFLSRKLIKNTKLLFTASQRLITASQRLYFPKNHLNFPKKIATNVARIEYREQREPTKFPIALTI
jgi:hypothetical protein